MTTSNESTPVETMHAVLGTLVQQANSYLSVLTQFTTPAGQKQIQQVLAEMSPSQRDKRVVSLITGDVLNGVQLALASINQGFTAVGAAIASLDADLSDWIGHPLFLIAADEDLGNPVVFANFLTDVIDVTSEQTAGLGESSSRRERNNEIIRLAERLLLGVSFEEEEEEEGGESNDGNDANDASSEGQTTPTGEAGGHVEQACPSGSSTSAEGGKDEKETADTSVSSGAPASTSSAGTSVPNTPVSNTPVPCVLAPNGTK